MKTDDSERREIEYLQQWEDYLNWEFIKTIIGTLWNGFVIGILATMIIIHQLVPYPDIQKQAADLIILFFVVFIIFIVIDAWELHKSMKKRNDFFKHQRYLVEDLYDCMKEIEISEHKRTSKK